MTTVTPPERFDRLVDALRFMLEPFLATLIGKDTPAGGEQQLFNTFDFLNYLEIRGLISKPPNSFVVA